MKFFQSIVGNESEIMVFFQTFASEILIALNPYRDIPTLYGPTVMRAVCQKATPHIYKIG